MTLKKCILGLLLASSVGGLGCAKKPDILESYAKIVWPPPPEPARVRLADQVISSWWATQPSGFRRFLASMAGGAKATGFKKPYDVATDAQGRLYVTDTGWGRVLVFDQAHKDFRFFGDSGQGALTKPGGIAIAPNGHVFVSDMIASRVFEYDEKFEFVGAYGSGSLVRPVGVAIDNSGSHLFVTDTKSHAIFEFDLSTGEVVKQIGERGMEPGQFNFPTNLDFGPDGNLYVMDTFNNRVQVLDADGAYLRQWGRNCDSIGCFSKPKGISVAGDGTVFVVDASFGNVQMFRPDGTMLMAFGSFGQEDGSLYLPAGVHVDDDLGKIYVVSQYSWRVNIYDYIGASADVGGASADVGGASPEASAVTPMATPPAGEP